MTDSEFRNSLDELGLTRHDAARLLSVETRTVRRWLDDGAELPGPAAEAIRAWVQLNRFGLPWRADEAWITKHKPEQLADQIARYRLHAMDLAKTLRKVEARGGPAAPWQVDAKRHRATLGAVEVTFYELRGGGFSPCGYSRSDNEVDLKRDWPLLEDAFYCIAEALANGRGRPKRAKQN